MGSILPPSGSAGPSLQVGFPAGEKEAAQRADFVPVKFDALIEMHGYRLGWARAAQCPCEPTNDQTEQADPNCVACAGAGYLYFNAQDAQPPAVVGDLTTVQSKLISQTSSSLIRGIITGVGSAEMPFDKLGRLQSGQAVVTVRPNNRIGYFDRLVAIDSYVIHTERLQGPLDETLPLKLRYLIDGGVNLLCSLTQRFAPDIDFQVVDGEVYFLPGKMPEPGLWLTAHYNCHPQYLVVEQPHASRITYTPRGKSGLSTPEGMVSQMPLQAVLRLDWLCGRDEAPGLGV